MSSRRVLKAAEAIREVVSTAILLELRDPRVQDVTVTRVEVAGDMRNAKVFVSVMGDESKENLCLHGLKNAAGFLQQKVGQRIDTRYIPRLSFEIDKGVKNSLKVAALLNQIREEQAQLDPLAESEVGTPDATESDGDASLDSGLARDHCGSGGADDGPASSPVASN
jgi:ribosome-binding factor A